MSRRSFVARGQVMQNKNTIHNTKQFNIAKFIDFGKFSRNFSVDAVERGGRHDGARQRVESHAAARCHVATYDWLLYFFSMVNFSLFCRIARRRASDVESQLQSLLLDLLRRFFFLKKKNNGKSLAIVDSVVLKQRPRFVLLRDRQSEGSRDIQRGVAKCVVVVACADSTHEWRHSM